MATRGAFTPRVERVTGVTDASGNVTFTWPVGVFTTAPVVTLATEGAAGFRSTRISANTATATTVAVQQSVGITLLGLGVLAAGVAAAGITVHAHAVAAP